MSRPCQVPILASPALAALVIALASCGPGRDDNNGAAAAPPLGAAPASAPAAPAPPPDIAADTAAAVQTPKDQPNFRVCLSSSLDKKNGPPLVVTAGVIFRAAGRRSGDERNPALNAGVTDPDAARNIVVLDRPVTLSNATPCAETVAQSLLSPIYEWTLPLVRKSQDLQFQVAGVENHMAFPLTDRLGGLVKNGLIFGYPTADIGNPRNLNRED